MRFPLSSYRLIVRARVSCEMLFRDGDPFVSQQGCELPSCLLQVGLGCIVVHDWRALKRKSRGGRLGYIVRLSSRNLLSKNPSFPAPSTNEASPVATAPNDIRRIA